jgi:ketosteroid isomerase-like protein
MKPRIILGIALVTLLQAQTARSATTEELVAQVRATEIAFANTMADRDLKAFASHVADEAVFFGQRGEMRGRRAVVDGWKAFFTETAAPFSWRPDTVSVLDSGNLALSSGPVFNAQGRRIGTFNSMWRLEQDGRWRVVFDNGCPACDCAPPAP